MFSERELKGLDRGYFNIIMANDYDLTLMSKNTGHYWYLHNPEYPEEGTVIIFHRHNNHCKESTYHCFFSNLDLFVFPQGSLIPGLCYLCNILNQAKHVKIDESCDKY